MKIKNIIHRLNVLRYVCGNFNSYLTYKKFKNYTMIPMLTYIKNLTLLESLTLPNGTLVECGSWRGGMVAGIASSLSNLRECYIFDSFQGLPDAKPIDGDSALNWQSDKTSPLYFDNCSADFKDAAVAMSLSGNKNFYIIKGWFEESLSKYPEKRGIAILRLDGDWYESTMECLNMLFPKVVKGGVIIIDDYYTWDGCSKAVHDYLSQAQATERVCQWQGDVAYIIKK